MDRDFGRSDMALNRGFGESFGRMGMVTVKFSVAVATQYQKSYKRRKGDVVSFGQLSLPPLITIRMNSECCL